MITVRAHKANCAGFIIRTHAHHFPEPEVDSSQKVHCDCAAVPSTIYEKGVSLEYHCVGRPQLPMLRLSATEQLDCPLMMPIFNAQVAEERPRVHKDALTVTALKNGPLLIKEPIKIFEADLRM